MKNTMSNVIRGCSAFVLILAGMVIAGSVWIDAKPACERPGWWLQKGTALSCDLEAAAAGKMVGDKTGMRFKALPVLEGTIVARVVVSEQSVGVIGRDVAELAGVEGGYVDSFDHMTGALGAWVVKISALGIDPASMPVGAIVLVSFKRDESAAR